MRSWPQHLGGRGIDLTGLAKDLRVQIEAKKNLKATGRWHRIREQLDAPRLWEEGEGSLELIQLRSGAHYSARRYALAHELGHAVLDRELDGRSTELPVQEQEAFANAFAAELLLPPSLARRLRDEFRQLGDVIGMLRLAQSVGAPPRVLMVRAKHESWLRDLDILWLDIRTAVNKSTGRDKRPRVYDYVRDPKRWYLPPNRSVQGVFGDDRWLASASPEMATTTTMDVSRPRGKPSRLVHEAVPAKVTAFRLRQATPGFGPEILARVELRPEDR